MRPQGAANAGLLREPSDSDGQVSLIVKAIKLLNEHLLNHYGRRFNYGLGMTKKIDSRTATPRLFVKLPFKGSAENFFQCSSLLSSPQRTRTRSSIFRIMQMHSVARWMAQVLTRRG